ncbi:MAG: SdrD B-like domain-containing protein, partial [Buchananella hordeovulneris]|nr:SdrD B-like domain-containing protein [Buchananella hordeovulneris]
MLGLKSRLAGLIAALAVLAVAVVSAVTGSAWAGPSPTNINPNVKITDIKVESVRPGAPVYTWSLVKIEWKWSAVGANPQPGQSFVLGLPIVSEPAPAHPLYIPVDIAAFDLKIGGASGNVIGTCTPVKDWNAPKVVCTFTDGLQNEINAGNTNLRGDAWLQAHAQESGTLTSGTFDANGIAISVPTPGGQPIGPNLNYEPAEPGKTNWGVFEANNYIDWHINFEGKRLKRYFQSNTFPSTITFRDHVGDGMVLAANRGFEFKVIGMEGHGKFYKTEPCLGASINPATGQPQCQFSPHPYPAPNDQFPDFGKFNLSVDIDPSRTNADIHLSPVGNSRIYDNATYRLSYRTTFTTPDGKPDKNRIYTNQINMLGTNFWSTNYAAYKVTAGGSAQMDPAFGTFTIGKQLEGPARAAFPVGSNVRFKVDWTLPGAAPAGWTAPDNPFYFEVPIDQRKTYLPENDPTKPFPTGTTIKITEDTTWGVPRGVVLDTPKVKIGDGDDNSSASVDFTIKEQEDTLITYTNTAQFKKVRVGDYVWEDGDKDGRQGGAKDKAIPNVTLTIKRTDGKPVVDVNGNTLTTTTTNDQGLYSFDNLPVLPENVVYKVEVTAPAGYAPTQAGPNNGGGADDSS